MDFIHLHTHSEYSVLDGIVKVKQLIARAKELGMTSVALTDKGSMYGLYEFWKECHEQEMKPIIGCEVFVAAKSRFDKNPTEKSSNLVLIAKNFVGYQNLVKIVSFGHLEGFYYKPRIDKELLEKYHEGIIVLSGHEWGELRNNLILGNEEQAEAVAKWYKDIFGPDYYIEVVRSNIEHEEELNQKLIGIAKKLDIPIVATSDLYYLQPDDYAAREIVWAIYDGKKLTDPTRRQDKTHESYFKTQDEMTELWKDYPEAIENTVKIADQVEDFKIGYGKVEPKSLDLPDGENSKDYLYKIAFEGAKTKPQFLNPDGTLQQRAIDRLEYELGIISTKGYCDYFLVVREYVTWANANGIPTTCRGSGASSLVAYSIGITPLDPLKWKLPFERFLNPERDSFPDFDIDFADDRRTLVFDHMREKYGVENTCNIGAIGRMKSRAIIRDVGRVMGIPLQITDKLSKLVTVKFGKPASLKEMMDPEKHPEFAQIVNESEDLKRLISLAQKIENNMRQMGTHACGFICVPSAVFNFVPLQRETKGDKRVITMIEGGKMENLGLMKFDFLGIANLSSIAIAVNLVEKYHGVKLKMREIPENDEKTFKLLQKADTNGVFQLESEGMKKYLRDLKPSTVEDISFMCAAYRPGPMQFIEPYILRKHGKEEVTYPADVLIPVLEETYGYAIYQEQVMEIARVFAGYTLGAADMLRRAMGKKIKELMEKEKQNFIEGSEKMGHTKTEAEKIFSYLEPFADYGFNKAHSAAYAMIAYQTAFLKANYTIEFIAALMQTDIEKADKLTRDILEAQAHGIEVLPSDINKSEVDFSIEEQSDKDGLGGKIRFGLGGLKTIGRNQVTEIIQARGDKPYTSLGDFLSRVDLKKVSKNAVEVLIKVGAMEEFGNRAQLLEVFEKAYDDANKLSKSSATATLSMFGEEEISSSTEVKLNDIPEVAPLQKVEWEKEYMGIYFSTHPLIKALKFLKKDGVRTINDLLTDCRTGSKIKIAATIKTVRTVLTKKDSKKMCFGLLEDADNTLPFTVFPQAYEKYGPWIEEGKSFIIEGKKNKRDEEYGILCDVMQAVDFSKYEGLPEPVEIQAEQKEETPAANIKSNKAFVPNRRPKPVQQKVSPAAVYDKVPASASPAPQAKIYANLQITIPASTDFSLLKKLNEYLVSTPGETAITIVMKGNDGQERKMFLNNKIAVNNATPTFIKNIIVNAEIKLGD